MCRTSIRDNLATLVSASLLFGWGVDHGIRGHPAGKAAKVYGGYAGQGRELHGQIFGYAVLMAHCGQEGPQTSDPPVPSRGPGTIPMIPFNLLRSWFLVVVGRGHFISSIGLLSK